MGSILFKHVMDKQSRIRICVGEKLWMSNTNHGLETSRETAAIFIDTYYWNVLTRSSFVVQIHQGITFSFIESTWYEMDMSYLWKPTLTSSPIAFWCRQFWRLMLFNQNLIFFCKFTCIGTMVLKLQRDMVLSFYKYRIVSINHIPRTYRRTY